MREFGFFELPQQEVPQNAKLQFQFQTTQQKIIIYARLIFLDKVFDCGVVKLIACYWNVSK